MKLNDKHCLVTPNLLLVPFENFHVPKYHNWMLSTELQELTASEPLTIKEEYAMQKSWRLDEDKLTFIILDKHCFYKNIGSPTNSTTSRHAAEVDSMIGDVNVFLQDGECNVNSRNVGEIEVMLAEITARGRGFGQEALKAMIDYSSLQVGVTDFVAKIGVSNLRSIALFQKLGFSKVKTIDAFQQIEYHYSVGQFDHATSFQLVNINEIRS